MNNRNQSDAPWRDVPADSDVVPGTEEPDPAEVTGEDEDDARDLASESLDRLRDSNQRDTLDERLAEEEPDRVARAAEPEISGLQAPETAGEDVLLAEQDEDGTDDEPPAEDAAMHITQE